MFSLELLVVGRGEEEGWSRTGSSQQEPSTLRAGRPTKVHEGLVGASGAQQAGARGGGPPDRVAPGPAPSPPPPLPSS